MATTAGAISRWAGCTVGKAGGPGLWGGGVRGGEGEGEDRHDGDHAGDEEEMHEFARAVEGSRHVALGDHLERVSAKAVQHLPDGAEPDAAGQRPPEHD